MKRIRGWNFENQWFVWSLLALVLLPGLVAALSIPSLPVTYGAYSRVALEVAVLGLVWGISQIFLGMAVATVGIGLSFAIILGMCAAVGSLVPLAGGGMHLLLAAANLAHLAGLLVMLLGVGVCAAAGWQRDRARCASASVTARGLAYCAIAGAGSGLMNVALVHGAPLIAAAIQSGAQAVWAPNAAWLVFLWSGAVPNLAFCLWRMRKNGSFGVLVGARGESAPASSWRWAVLMSLCWMGSALLYARGAGRMGSWGPVFAWPIYMSLIVISGNIAGVFMGEWRSPSPVPMRRMAQGVGLLTLAVFLLAGRQKGM
jgi:L-rhamnose-H+ transport protein